jgi:colicin import membrane protein
MAELFESSGLHSLAFLREHEKRRAQHQAEAVRVRAEAEQRARHEAERIEQERRLAERAARENAESTQRAEVVSLQNARRVEFDRAEALVQANAQLKQQLESERSARRSFELGLTAKLLRQRLWTGISTTLCLGSGLTVIGLYFGVLQPNAEHAAASARNALLGEQKALSDAQQRELRSNLRADGLKTELASLERTLREERERRATPAPSASVTRRVSATPGPKPTGVVKPCRDDGDPLNPCLKR